MRPIVIITTPGAMKRDFVNVLQKDTDGAISLVIVQEPVKMSVQKRIRKFLRKISVSQFPCEVYSLIQMSLKKKLRDAVTITKARTPISDIPREYMAPVLKTYDVNDQKVVDRINEINPSVIAIWGGSIVRSPIIQAADRVVNIHTGYCPYYRGTNCNLNAILNDDFEHIGITLHKVISEVDAGDIYTVITPVQTNAAFKSIFTDLNDRAFTEYVDLVKQLWLGFDVPSIPQDIRLGKDYMLKDWTYIKQYRVAMKIINHDQLVFSE